MSQDSRCPFCQGWGHKIGRCSTKKALDRQFSQTKILKSTWGKLKGRLTHDRVAECVLLGVKRRKLLNEAFEKSVKEAVEAMQQD